MTALDLRRQDIQSAFNQVHPSVQPAIKSLVDGVSSILGINLNKLVLIGSAIRNDFAPEISDVDVVILVNVQPNRVSRELFDLKQKLEISYSIDCQFAVPERVNVERWSEFELCWQGKISKGVTLFDSGNDFSSYRIPREQAKKEVVAHYLIQSDQWLKRSLLYQTEDFPLLSEWEACRAVCRTLQAALLRYEIDPSPKALRWNLRGLFEAAEKVCDGLEAARAFLDKLPPDLALQEKGEVLCSEDPAPRKAHVKSVCANAKKLITACKRGLNE